MAYNRRNDTGGRVVGFKDGMPVYKRTNPGEDRKPRYNDRDRDGKYDRRDEYAGKRTYNRKNEGHSPAPERGSDAPRREFDRDGRHDRRFDERRDERKPDRRFEDRKDDRRFEDRKDDRRFDERRDERFRRGERRYEDRRFADRPREVPAAPQEEAELPNIIMGRNPVKEAIKSGRSIDRILVTKEHDGSLNEILDLAYEAKLVIRDVDRAKLDEICMPFGHNGRTGNHQGIIAYIPGVEYCELSDILDYAKEKGEAPFIVLLDGIEDPHNLGSIIRSAECAGAHGVVITKRRSASVTAAVVKTSAGATEHMRIAKVVNLPAAIERLKSAGVWVACADMSGEPVFSADLKGPFALAVGAEGAGVSRLVKEKCDYTVSIPLSGEIGSLNASVAAAVIMFEKVRQERAGK